MSVWSNKITGEIPHSIFHEPFSTLDIESNFFVGSIPTEAFETPTLKKLRVSFNDLEGDAMPSNIGGLAMLEDLWIAGNKFAGSTPSEIGLLSNLDSMFIYGNMITGSIPSEIGLMSNLVGFQVQGNDLNGTFPSEFFDNKSMLKVLRVDDNDLSGPFPASLAHATALTDLRLANNAFTGKLTGYDNLTELGESDCRLLCGFVV